MNAMPVGGAHEPAKESLQPRWDKDVAVVEHGDGIEQNFEKKDAEWRRSDGGDGAKFDRGREQNLHGMEARAGSDIDVQNGVVHAMEPPHDQLVNETAVVEGNQQI